LQELLALVKMVSRVRQRALLEKRGMTMAKAWETHFNERELKEIEFARKYASDFNHGTDGHIRLILLARLADLLDMGLVPHNVTPREGPVNPKKPRGMV
jgi:hypothetical protein